MRALGVLGGASLPPEDILQWQKAVEKVVAADHGFDHLQALNLLPDCVIGDFDSVVSNFPVGLRTIRDTSQDTTDCEKLLQYCATEGIEEVFLSCIHGPRIDHLVSSFDAALKVALKVRWILPAEIGILLRPGDALNLSFAAPKGVSIMPLEPTEFDHSQGLKWPIEGRVLKLGSFVSQSNVASSHLELRLATGAALVFLERSTGEVLLP